MPDAKTILFAALGLVALMFVATWARATRGKAEAAGPGPLGLAIGFVTNFFDTLGIGSFAPTTAWLKLRSLVPDRFIPATLNAGHCIPTIVQGLVTVSPINVHLPRVDTAETFFVQQNAPADQTYSYTTIPGLKVVVYAGTTITMSDGTRPNPYPLAGIQVPADRRAPRESGARRATTAAR